MLKKLKHIWHMIRDLSGDNAYEQYLKHYAEFHQATVDTPPPLSRKAFFKLWQDSKWKGVKRCC
ncbi:MAG: YbdD/YjiX family protein [Methylotenera sp.]|jgi:uncharacterized short protein YbdD (DUF466 family)|nr:YbdD/YjiX family protein [Methylotenera sp.]